MSWQPGPYGNNPQQPQQPQQPPQQPPPQQGFPEFQPGYGPPAGPPPGTYGPGPGDPYGYGPPPKKGGGSAVVILVVVVAVLVVAGLGTGAYFLFFKKDSSTTASDPSETSGPSPSTSASAAPVAKPLWEVPLPKGWDSSRMTTVIGSWMTDQVVVRGQRDSIVAYKLSDGQIAWQLPADGVGFCGMSSSVREGVGFVSYGPLTDTDNITCSKLQAVDLATGKPRWDTDVVSASAQYPPDEGDGKRPEVFGDVVATAADGGAVRTLNAYDASSKAARWSFYGTQYNPLGKGECTLEDRRVSKDRLLVVAGCSPQERTFGQEQTVVFAINAATGRPDWATPIPTDLVAVDKARYVTLVGTDHPAIYIKPDSAAKGQDKIVGLDPATGKLGTPIPTGDLELELTPDGMPRMSGEPLAAPSMSNDSTLLMKANVGEGINAEIGFCVPASGLVAFDLKAGKPLWTKPAAVACEMSVLGFDGEDALVLDGGGPYKEPPKLVKVDRSGRPTTVKQLGGPQDEDGDVRTLRPGSAFHQNGLVVVLPDLPSSSYFPYFAVALSAK